ncbi:unnamed protein product, partial [Prorocentrum cordatum]
SRAAEEGPSRDTSKRIGPAPKSRRAATTSAAGSPPRAAARRRAARVAGPMEGWKKLLLAAGGAAGAAAVLYCLIRDDREQRPHSREVAAAAEGEEKKKFTKEQALRILREVADSQESIRKHMKALTKGLIDSGSAVDFDSIYSQIHAVQPEDPLERHGLSVPDFDQLLNQYQGDPEAEGMARIMGCGGRRRRHAGRRRGCRRRQADKGAHLHDRRTGAPSQPLRVHQGQQGLRPEDGDPRRASRRQHRGGEEVRAGLGGHRARRVPEPHEARHESGVREHQRPDAAEDGGADGATGALRACSAHLRHHHRRRRRRPPRPRPR